MSSPTVARHQDPLIPCSSCGERMHYVDAVPRKFGEVHMGYAHPAGECEPTAIAEWTRRTGYNGWRERSEWA